MLLSHNDTVTQVVAFGTFCIVLLFETPDPKHLLVLMIVINLLVQVNRFLFPGPTWLKQPPVAPTR